jgi:hypothetical protein
MGQEREIPDAAHVPDGRWHSVPGARSPVFRRIILAFRMLGAFLGWALFIYWWTTVLKPDMASKTHIELSVLLIGVAILSVIVTALFWIRHNLDIASAGQRGGVSRYMVPKFDLDYLGRTLKLPDREILVGSAVIFVRAEGDQKTYSVGASPVATTGEKFVPESSEGYSP